MTLAVIVAEEQQPNAYRQGIEDVEWGFPSSLTHRQTNALHFSSQETPYISISPNGSAPPVKLLVADVNLTWVHEVEVQLRRLVTSSMSSTANVPYPLDAFETNAIEADIAKGIQSSWESKRQLPDWNLLNHGSSYFIENVHEAVSYKRRSLLESIFAVCTPRAKTQSMSFELLCCANRAPQTALISDLVRASYHRESLIGLNPFFQTRRLNYFIMLSFICWNCLSWMKN
jgi:hypothetical protein